MKSLFQNATVEKKNVKRKECDLINWRLFCIAKYYRKLDAIRLSHTFSETEDT